MPKKRKEEEIKIPKSERILNKKYNNFLISGSGRSGTRFLSNLMNKSKTWTVLHEPGLAGVENYSNQDQCDKTSQRFLKDNYGEVNSMLRRIFLNIPVSKRGVLIRNPYDIYLSIANRKDVSYKWIEEFEESLKIITFALSDKKFKVKRICFDKLTTDVNYANSILKWFGIDDVELTIEDITTKVNFTLPENKKYKKIEDLPKEVQEKVIEVSEQFLENIKND